MLLNGTQDDRHWKDVELLMAHTNEQGASAFDKKCTQWLRCAWTLFCNQPYRRYCFGIIFVRQQTYIAYADHSCASFSSALNPGEERSDCKYLIKFLTSFMRSDRSQRGSDPDIYGDGSVLTLMHNKSQYTMEEILFHYPHLIGRNVVVFEVSSQGGSDM